MAVQTPYPELNAQSKELDDCAAMLHEAVGAERALEEALIRMRLRFGTAGTYFWKAAYNLVEELQQGYHDDIATLQSEWVDLFAGLATLKLTPAFGLIDTQSVTAEQGEA